jgi:hypothetical protein
MSSSPRKASGTALTQTVALFIVEHESHFRPGVVGDDKGTSRSRGLWQIFSKYHPEVSDEMAFSPKESTKWALARIKAGYANEWSTFRFCRKWFRHSGNVHEKCFFVKFSTCSFQQVFAICVFNSLPTNAVENDVDKTEMTFCVFM